MEIILDISSNIEDLENEINFEHVERFVKDIINNNYISKNSKNVYISLYFTNNEEIKEINREYRNKDSATDVISFAYHETEEIEDIYDTLGDIIISIEKVKEQAIEYGHSFEREFYYVLTHGILHLLGYDHINKNDKIKMREKEEEILNKYNLRR